MTTNTDFNLSASQEKALEELRRRMIGHMDVFKEFDQSFVYYRFLKARNWDLNKAEIMLKKTVQFRKRIDVDALMRDYQPPEILKMFIENFHIGYDKEGCQVFYVPIGRCDPKGLIKATKPNEIDRTITKLFAEHEYLLEKTIQEKNRWLPGIVIILDVTGLTLEAATYRKGIETLLKLARSLQDNAPERLKALFVINALPLITIPFNIIKHFLTSDTLRKIQVFGEEGWKEELLKIIDADCIPAFMGGRRTDPDGNPLCKTILNQMGKVDESYYLVKDEKPLANSPGVKKLNLLRSSSTKIPLHVNEPGSVIEWEFETKTGDIGFGLFYKETGHAEEQVMELVPLERVDTKNFVERGMYKCEKPGYYFMLFDNSYSWFQSKELFYRLQVFSPHAFEENMKEKLTI